MTATTYAIAARPRTALVSLFVVSFLCGAAAGAVAMRQYAFKTAHHDIQLSESKAMTLARWKANLDLTDDQTAQLRMILDDFNKYYDNVLAEGHERILRVLTPEQQRKFERSLHEKY